MKNNAVQELGVGVILIVLIASLLSAGSDMSMGMKATLSAFLVAGFALFAGFVWNEKAGDEREELHRNLAGRAAFLTGVAVGILGIVVQSIGRAVDPWLVVVVGAMILTKIAARLYSRVHF